MRGTMTNAECYKCGTDVDHEADSNGWVSACRDCAEGHLREVDLL